MASSPPPAPPSLYNFQEWLANEALQVQDGILPSNNLQDSPYAAWNDSISHSSSTSNSDSDALVLVPASILQALQRNGSLNFANNTVTPPVQHNELMIPREEGQTSQIQLSISIINAGMNISFSADNEFMNGMLIAEPLSYVPSPIFSQEPLCPPLPLLALGPMAMA